MQSQNRLLDDLARVASGAFGVASGMRSEVESRLREQFERILSQMDLVTREEYEVAHTMAQNAREEQEALAERLAAVEARLAEVESQGPKQTARASGTGKAKRAKSGGKTTANASSSKTAADTASGGTGSGADDT